jgi:hypothetical protein
MIILVIFGSHLEKGRHFYFCCRYSNCIVSIDSVDLKYIGDRHQHEVSSMFSLIVMIVLVIFDGHLGKWMSTPK